MQQLESEQSHRAAVEQSWKESQAAAARAEERVTASAAEINKGNQIIEKLQVHGFSHTLAACRIRDSFVGV